MGLVSVGVFGIDLGELTLRNPTGLVSGCP
jgi:hypothetical protein